MTLIPVRYRPHKSIRIPTDQDQAWFLGMFYGDGNMHRGKGDYRVSISGDRLSVSRWLRLLGRRKGVRKIAHAEAHEAVIYSKGLIEWLESRTGMSGAKSHNLIWPELPRAYLRDFIRGLWDSDGSVYVIHQRPKHGRPHPVAVFTSVDGLFVERLRQVIKQELGIDLPAITLTTTGGNQIRYYNAKAIALLDWLYAESPTPLRNELRYSAYKKAKLLWQRTKPREYLSASGAKGVTKTPAGRWAAKIMKSAWYLHVGTFDSKRAAVLARSQKLIELGLSDGEAVIKRVRVPKQQLPDEFPPSEPPTRPRVPHPTPPKPFRVPIPPPKPIAPVKTPTIPAPPSIPTVPDNPKLRARRAVEPD